MEENIIKWINIISENKDELNGFSVCPFAKKALQEEKIYISSIDDEPIFHIMKYIENLYDKEFEVIIFYNSNNSLTDSDLKIIINVLQKNMPDIIFLKDHPDNPGYIGGIHTGNGVYPIILAQPKEKLYKAREKLKNTKYYEMWSEEYKNEIWSYGNDLI